MITTMNNLPPEIAVSYSGKLLSTPVPNHIYSIPAMKHVMKAGEGHTTRFRRFNSLGTAMVPLDVNGSTPPSKNLVAVDIDARINYYGTYLKINEQVTISSSCPVLNAAAERLGVCLRETEDQLTADCLAATASHIDATAGVNGDNPTELTRADIDEAVRTLLGNNAKTIMDYIPGQNRFGSAPVRNAFFALCNSNLSGNLDAIPGFTHNSQYPSQQNVLPSEWGAIGNLRFLISSIGSVTRNSSALGRNVYNISVVGMEAYAMINQEKYGPTFIYRPAWIDDPLAQNCTVGFKTAFVPKILNDLWVLNLRCTMA